MAHRFTEIKDGPSKKESTGSKTSIIYSLYDYTITGDTVLRSMIEKYSFQALSEEVVIKGHATHIMSLKHKLNDFLSLTFPQKL